MASMRPNILFVFDDQHRYSALGCSGNTIIRTPHIDRLAGQGIVFDQAFSNCPICSPYRGNLLTGRYPHQHGVVDNEYRLWTDQLTLPQVLQDAGYRTAFIGKWHLGYGPYPEDKRYGFQYMAAYNCDHRYYQVQYYENERGPIQFGCWAPEGETDLAIRYLEAHKKRDDGAPFLLMVAWGPPHWPYDQYPQEFHIYDPAGVDVPANVPVQMEAFARQEIAHYYGNVTALDAQMGRLLEALDRLGLAENTIVCFTSDHGDHLSSHGYGKPMDLWLHPSKRPSKASPYEEAIHVPFVLRFPGRVPAGRRTDGLIGTVDIMPTLLGLCGVEVPPTVMGKNLSHVAVGEDRDWPDSVYLQILGPCWPDRRKSIGFWRGVRNERWTYARWWRDEHEPLLFDHQSDRYEMNDLAGKEEYADVQAGLELRLQQWMAETGDPFDTGKRDPVTGMLQLGQEFSSDRWSTTGHTLPGRAPRAAEECPGARSADDRARPGRVGRDSGHSGGCDG